MSTFWVLVIIGVTTAPAKQIEIMSIGAYESKAECVGILGRLERESPIALKFARACVPAIFNPRKKDGLKL